MRIFTVIAAAAVSLFATTALAAEHVGTAEAVTAPARVSDQKLVKGKEYELEVGHFVETGDKGEAKLHFGDDTQILLSSKTGLAIDEAPGASAKEQITLSLDQGSLRVIVGGVRGELEIKYETPTARIEHQGTAFDLTVTSLGVTKLLLLEGQVTLCGKDEGDDCETVATPCALLQSESGEDVEEITLENGRVRETREHFPFQTSDSTLPDEFRFAGPGCLDGSVAGRALAQQAIPTEAIIVGAFVVIGGIVIGLVSANDSNNKTND